MVENLVKLYLRLSKSYATHVHKNIIEVGYHIIGPNLAKDTLKGQIINTLSDGVSKMFNTISTNSDRVEQQ